MKRTPCPKCGAAMAEGFIVDDVQGWRKPAAWVEGPPKKSIWFGLALRGRRRIPVRTLRCDRCGFLESYASA